VRDRVDPKLNAWMKEPKPEAQPPSTIIRRLADRLRKDPHELASSLPADTVRRTRYPVIEIVHDDGTVEYRQPIV
jgi:hypothetical protein